MRNGIIIKICAFVSFVSGVIIILSFILPIAIYEAKSNQEYPELISPLPLNYQPFDLDSSNDQSGEVDYTKASNWFVSGAGKEKFAETQIRFYTISIPKLNIENATVSVGGEDLADSLIQYPGTAEPGSVGNSVVFGHSILPLFYNPENYLAIFSTLDRLEEGDLVYVDHDGVSYTYEVETKYEVRPTDVYILDQDSITSQLSLVTCTPPGHPAKPKRLVVEAKIINNIQANAISRD